MYSTEALASVALLAALLLPASAARGDARQDALAARATAEDAVQRYLGFHASLSRASIVALGERDAMAVAVVASEDAARVACARAARPMPRAVCRQRGRAPAVVVGAPVTGARPGFVWVEPDYGTEVPNGQVEPTVVEADGDPARELAVDVTLARRWLFVLDEDGGALFERQIDPCVPEYDDEGNETKTCHETEASFADTDADGRAELRVSRCSLREVMLARLETLMDHVDAGEDTEELGYEWTEEDERSCVPERDHFVFDPAEGRYVPVGGR